MIEYNDIIVETSLSFKVNPIAGSGLVPDADICAASPTISLCFRRQISFDARVVQNLSTSPAMQ